jgi:hypothetical protein
MNSGTPAASAAPEAGRFVPYLYRLPAWIMFASVYVFMSWNQPAWDLSAGYLAGRMVANGDIAAIYTRNNPADPAKLGPAWRKAADAGGITGQLTPYVQTPLWAIAVAPLAAAVKFSTFARLFAVLSAAAMMAMIQAAARQWAPRVAGPGWQAILLAGLFVTTPCIASIVLGQTHVVFLCLAVCAAIAVLNGQEITAGALLAAAVSVKITPVWLALTWAVAGYYRAVASFVAASAVLLGVTIGIGGVTVFTDYLRSLGRIGNNVLLSFNNDSFASVALGGSLNTDTAFHWVAVPLPLWLKAASVAALASVAVFAGRLDRARNGDPARQTGAILTLVAATAFMPLAWNHYFIVLILPVMLLIQIRVAGWRWLNIGLVAAIFALSVPPLAYYIGAPISIVALRSHFWAALLCLAGVMLLDTLRRRHEAVARA